MALGRVSSPWLMLPPSFENGGMSYNFYSLTENRVVSLKKKPKQGSESPNDNADVVGSSHGWLALYYRRDHSLFLSNPITGENIKLPPIDTGRILEGAVKKVILSSPPHQQDCRAIISYAYDSISYLCVAVCSPGRSSDWTDIYIYDSHEDIVYSTADRLFFGLLNDDVEAWDCNDPFDPKVIYNRIIYLSSLDQDDAGRTTRDIELIELYGSWPMRHLVYVEHTDHLLLVKRHYVELMAPDGSPIEDRENWHAYPHKTVNLDVYEIDARTGRLRYMEDSLNGLVLFVGINHSLAVRAAEFPELKPDSIYFTEATRFSSLSGRPDYMYGGHDIGIFDYMNKTISPCYYPCDHRSFKKIHPSPLWFTPSPH